MAQKPRGEKSQKKSARVLGGIGRRMKRTREAHNLTLKRVAEKIGCTVPYLSELENGKGNPSASLLFDWCNALNADPTYILTGRTNAKDVGLADRFEVWRSVLGRRGLDFLREVTDAEFEVGWERFQEAVLYLRSQFRSG